MRKYLLMILLILSFSLISCDKIIPNNNSNNNDKLNINNYKDDDTTNDKTPSTVNKKVRLFFFDTKDYVMYYIDKEILVTDKAIIKALTNELQNYSLDENTLNLSKEVEITSANIDPKTNVLKIVFSSSYTSKMTLGSATESGLLSSLLSTYGYNLDVDKIAIYFGDELYTSLRGELLNGYFDVYYEDAIPYNK